MAGIVSLVRQICLLREQGDAARAAALEAGELADALRTLREADGGEALPESALAALFAREEERIADAQVLAELLAPRLGAVLPSAQAATVTTVTTVTTRAPEPPAEPLSIPDLLDAMLAAERTSPRTRR
jgi:hypothetical protein